MFNRSAYNKTNFNRINAGASGNISSNALLSFSSAAEAGRIRKAGADSNISFGMTINATRIVPIHPATAEISLGTSCKLQKRVSVYSSADISLGMQTVYYAFGVEELSLRGLVLGPGDELVIDTDLMTVTLNGVNVTRYVNGNSKFIKLLAGNNTLVYQDGSGLSREAAVRVEWKARWL
jgi:hypothetical protein